MLAHHNPEEALRYFNQALDACPVDKREGFTRILFYTGISLQKLGYGGCAVKSWKSAAQIRKNGLCNKMIERMTNSYGMTILSDSGGMENIEDSDDFRAFSTIQQTRYLVSRMQGRFGSQAEKDMVLDIIRTAWEELSDSQDLKALSIRERIRLFHEELIIFPYLECPEEWENDTIPYDFKRNQRVFWDSPCTCGSGRPYGMCCGRIPSEDELEFGLF